MPYTLPKNRKTFDVMLNGRASIFVHISDRATRAGAIGPAMSVLRGRERDELSGVRVQQCGDDGECWGARSSGRT